MTIPIAQGLVTHTLCQCCTLVASPTDFGRYQICIYVVQANEVNGQVNFWMSETHDSSLVPLVDTVKHMGTKIPCTVYARQAPACMKIHPTT